MAIFRPGGVVASISGNLGGVNFVLGKQGPYCRKVNHKRQMSSAAQLEHRAAAAMALHYWQDLSSEERLSWRRVAANIPVYNRFGFLIKLSGWQLWCKNYFNWYPFVSIPHYPCELVGYSLVPNNMWSHLEIDGDWLFTFSLPVSKAWFVIKLFAARPFRKTECNFFSNYKLIYYGNVYFSAGFWRLSWSPTGIFHGCALGEFIGFKAQFNITDVGEYVLHSKNFHHKDVIEVP